MAEWLGVLIAAAVLVIIWQLFRIGAKVRTDGLLREKTSDQLVRLADDVQQALLVNRREMAESGRMLREEVGNRLQGMADGLARSFDQMLAANDRQLKAFSEQLAQTRQQLDGQMNGLSQRLDGQLSSTRAAIDTQLARNAEQLAKIIEVVNGQLRALQEDNSRKLEEMRRTVDEKLHASLEKRLGESFQLVSERLEMVHRGLGEMQSLAAGVGDLKRVLTNVKTRGVWGEVQLESIIEQLLTSGQYEKNVATIPGSSERVEFAVKLPGRDNGLSQIWLPIDAKFPLEDYQNLLNAHEQGDGAAVEACRKRLAGRLVDEAKRIAGKYVAVPHTTDFAIMFLPTEGLYAEGLRIPGLAENLANNHRVVVAGPTTLMAVLNSLRIGFRTLAIEQRSAEVWRILGAIKTEFVKFGNLLDKTSKKIQETGNTIGQAAQRSRAIERQLKKVEGLPADESNRLLELPPLSDGDEE
ncbi:MAG: DNA recombination protein RmuC [Negativicutes bacterium]|nr:DNA recombination protein RmuC [Negativicutes bacterium]